MRWAYGITTVPGRRGELFPRTLASLINAGFSKPRLFIDGTDDLSEYKEYGLEITLHNPKIRTFGNWALGLAELFIRNPVAERFAMFQDDFVTYRNLRAFLDNSPYPQKGYLNLYTFPVNQKLAQKNGTIGWYLSDQLGKGAVAIVMSREALLLLLHQQHFVDRPMDPKRGHCAIDGGIATAFKKIEWKEYVHNPSLVQHTGHLSSMGNRVHPLAQSFRGEEFDALELLSEKPKVPDQVWELMQWQQENTALENAIADDKIRLGECTTSQGRMHFAKLIRQYERKLASHQKEKPS